MRTPETQLVDIKTHRPFVNIEGTGTPTVVIETGWGGLSLAWWRIQKEVSQITQVLTYDLRVCDSEGIRGGMTLRPCRIWL